jgi:hypothetical protein
MLLSSSRIATRPVDFAIAMMPLRCRGTSGFHEVRTCPNGTFYTERHACGFRLTLGTYDMPELAALL